MHLNKLVVILYVAICVVSFLISTGEGLLGNRLDTQLASNAALEFEHDFLCLDTDHTTALARYWCFSCRLPYSIAFCCTS